MLVRASLPIGKIVTGDCLDVMDSFPDESIGMILTSPPYNVGLGYDGLEDNLTDVDFKAFNLAWVQKACRVAMDTARMYVVVSEKMIWWFRECAEAAGWRYGQKLTWCKPNFGGKSIRNSGDWNMMAEDILLFRKGKRTPMLSSYETTTHNWFVIATQQSNFTGGRIHPAQMPFRLCKRLISRTPGDPILDPFAGSGQVLRAAKSLGRPYIGIELVPDVAERAREFVSNSKVTDHSSIQSAMQL